ncbi:M28 family peptidase [Blastomonas aquatica]|uniref:Peptidase M28 n=1 Tax=Blastomonas aquatica TaxID=1510276 RepID=A0ABQ1JCC9_9SPHN|nr:M28 family peptidase [Blastomonas aquatica]GGB63880.1 peptidase M28 [Blastomonas aquatica]
MITSFRACALSALALVTALSHGPATAQQKPAPISESEVRAHIAVLASDDFEGRAPGTSGEMKTIDYLAKTWDSYGLVSGTNDPANPWFQPVPLVERKPYAQSFSAMRGTRPLKIDSDALILTGRNATDAVSGAPVFVGHGVGADGKLNADVRGRIVIMLSAEPKFEGAAKLPTRREREKLLAEAGAAAVLLTAPKGAPWASVRTALAGGSMRLASDDVSTTISGLIRPDAANALIKPAGMSLATATKRAGEPDFVPVDLPVTLELAASTQVRSFASHNVIGKIPGAKPGSGAVVLLGHWDHFGICRSEEAEDRICNGAVDNASGMAVLLTVAERLARAAAQGAQLDRDVYFMGTTAEERGLLGAYHFADNPVVPLDQIVVALNIDTVAIAPKGAPVALVGRGESGLDEIVDQIAIAGGRTVDTDTEANAFIRRQDGWALGAKGVKSIMAGGSFSDMALLQAFLTSVYHQPDDELTDKTELGGAADDANLHIDLVRHFADEAKYNPATTGD